MTLSATRAPRLVGSFATLAAAVAIAAAPDGDAGLAPAELETITVTGAKREKVFRERVSTFVSSVTGSRAESLARWQVPVCPYVTGATPEQNEFMRRHLSQVARDAGAPVAGAGCGVNLIVVLAADPERVLRDWWGEEHRLFNRDRGVAGIERFLESDEPIRAWYNACDVAPDWAKSSTTNRRLPPCGAGELGSRLTWSVVRSIYSVIAVVDLNRIEGLGLGQVADYLAMIGLAPIRRDADLGKLPTILRLFTTSPGLRPRGLSSWDKTLLRSLYETDPAAFTQVAQVKQAMGQELGGMGPDQSAAVARLLSWTNRVTPGASRVVSYTEVGAYYEGSEGLRSVLVNFEAELEFVGDGFFAGRRKAGDCLQVYGDVQFIDEGEGWRLLGMAVYPR